jgi:two-component system, sensor histidine kinase and response regulator
MASGKRLSSDRPGPRIAIVDDDPAHLQVVKIILTRESLATDLHLFDDPIVALEYLAKEPVNLILLDIGMARMGGFDVYARLRTPGPNQTTPIIFLTAFKETETIVQAFELGAADVLGKPLISPILTARIRSILDTQDLQRQLRLRNDELETTNRLKDEMVSICSHDLRSPLSAIDLICQFLNESIEGRSKHSAPVLVNRIINQSRLARRLVDNLLDLNRIEEGKLLPTPSFFRMRDLLATCTEDEVPLLQARGVKLLSTLPPEDVLCFGDREMIAQVIRNVLGNAIKFTRSHVNLETRVVNGAGDTQGEIELTVTDDGPGVPAEDLAVIFDKYRKSDLRTLGSGLGLFISRKMVELHHGKIVAGSDPGKGARFTITLPHVIQAGQLPDLAELTDGRVLVVSASKPNALLLEGVLIEAGLVHVTKEWSPDAESGSTLPHIVVVDAQAPAMDRLTQIVRAFKDAGVHPAWIVVGSEQEAATVDRWTEGSHERLPVPINPLVYLRRIHALLVQPGGKGDESPVLQRAARA